VYFTYSSRVLEAVFHLWVRKFDKKLKREGRHGYSERCDPVGPEVEGPRWNKQEMGAGNKRTMFEVP